ncbi:MAG: SPOR domain-containing protein [Thioalkalivibrionaceae bacterium]
MSVEDSNLSIGQAAASSRADDLASTPGAEALRLRFRLLGASALLLVAVLFLPWIFDGAGWAEITGEEIAPVAPPAFRSPDFSTPPNSPSLPMERPVMPDVLAEPGIAEPGVAVARAPAERSVSEEARRRDEIARVEATQSPQRERDAPRVGETRDDRLADGVARTREALAASESASSPTSRSDTAVRAENQPRPAAGRAAANTEAAGEGWIVQLGSFRDRANAEVLARRVQSHGLQAFIEAPSSAEGSNLHRVRIGPYRERGAADRVRDRLSQQHGIESIVVPLTRPTARP